MLAYPCPHPEQGCPRYGEGPGIFNLLAPPPPRAPREVSAIPNEEAKQPPLAYALYGLPLRAVGARGDPASVLLGVRLLNVALVAVALFGPLRRVFASSPGASCAGLLALLTPGACEAFARCSNDAAVFLWSAALLDALVRPGGAPPAGSRACLGIVALLAIGPLLKLTALAVCAFAVVALWLDRRRTTAVAGALASAVVLPVQALRGWTTGGALELGRPAAAAVAVPGETAWA